LPESLICRHFGICGGCSLQDLPDRTYAEVKRERVAGALNRRGLHTHVHEPIRVPPHSRRRAVFKAMKLNGAVALGFQAASSHAVVDMQECLVLTPALVEACAGLRRLFAELLADGGSAELHVTDTDVGLDLAIRWTRKTTPELVAALSRWARRGNVARVITNSDVAFSVASPMVRLAEVEVDLPPGGVFLQATREGERALQEIVCNALSGAKSIADLFAGCGTFSLALARDARVHAFDASNAMLATLARAARRAAGMKPVIVEQRDLFRRPLSARELSPFDGTVLDPPRAGARAQVRELAGARVARIAYVSCSAESFARDARILCDAGFGLPAVTPIDQFLWSDHIELVGVFERGSR